MADTTIHQLQVSLPGAGNTQTYHLDADTPVKFDFDLANAVFTGVDGNLEITVEGGGTIILENYQALADAGSLPLFEMINGQQVEGDVYLFAFDGTDQNADVETAAGNATGSSGAGTYDDDPGTLLGGLAAMDGQGDAYGTHDFPTLTDVTGDIVTDGDTGSTTEISGDDTGAMTEDVNVSATGLLADSGQLIASAGTFTADTLYDSRGGTFHINADGTWSYEVSNDSVQYLGEVDGVNSGYTSDFTVYSSDGTAHVVTVTVAGDNDAPEGADFTVYASAYGEAVSVDFDVAPITDVEDDYSTTDGLDTGVVITSLPEHGTLYYDGVEVTQADVDNGTRYDDLDNFTYVADSPSSQGVLLGAHLSADAGLDTWGEMVDASTRQLSVDTDGDGTTDVTITTHISSGSLMVFNDQRDHIDHGLANKSNSGIDEGEALTITFDGQDVSYAEIGFGGLGEYFSVDNAAQGEATWAVYNDGVLIASGTVNNSVMTWTNYITDESGTIGGGDGDTFQSLILDQTILGGESFDTIVFGTTEDSSRDWNANWELQYIDVEFAGTDSFTYQAIDSEGQLSDDNYTVTVEVLAGAANDAPTAVADTASVYEPNINGLDSSVTANVLDNDTDTDSTHSELYLSQVSYDDTTVNFVTHTITGDDASFNSDGSVTIQGQYGTLTIYSDGTYTYTATDNSPEIGDTPTETFTYTMTDGDDGYSSATLTIDITPVEDNTAPTAVDESGVGYGGLDTTTGVFEAAVVSGNALANDYDAEDVDYTDGSGYPTGSTELTVTGVAAGNLDNLTDAEYSQLLADGDFDGDSGTFDPGDDGVGTTVYGEYGYLVIAADGSYTYTTYDGLASGDYSESFTYQVSDSDGAVDYGVIEVSATIDSPVLGAESDLGHGAWVTNTVENVESSTLIAGATTSVDFSDTDGDDSWTALAQSLGLTVSGVTSAGGTSQVVQYGSGIGLNSTDMDTSDLKAYLDLSDQIGHGTAVDIVNGSSSAYESLILDFGNGADEPLNVSITLGDVGSTENVIITVVDSDGTTYTFNTVGVADGTTITDSSGSGVTLLKVSDGEYVVQGTQADSDGNGEVLIDTITLAAGDNASFTLTSLDVTDEGTWQTSTTPTVVQYVTAATGNVLDNDYSSNDATMVAAIVGSGVGTWGTLDIDAATGNWTYTVNESAVFDSSTGLDSATVEQFTYSVTANGVTETATLYIPVHYNATESAEGTSGSDVVYGDSTDNTINGLEGNDFLYGEGGEDTIHGGTGHDYISGGDGTDHLYGGEGNDYLFGDKGNDYLYGEGGDDHLFGGAGNDHIWGGSGDDVIDAGSGDDYVYISSGHDTVTLGSGADTIVVDASLLTSGEGGGAMTVTDYNVNEGDNIDLSSLSSGVVDVTSDSDSGNLILTISDVNAAGDDITITLQGVMPATHDAVDHQVDLSATGDDLNTVVQHIINSGGHTS